VIKLIKKVGNKIAALADGTPMAVTGFFVLIIIGLIFHIASNQPQQSTQDTGVKSSFKESLASPSPTVTRAPKPTEKPNVKTKSITKGENMDLIKAVDSFLESPRPIDPPRAYRGFYPSAASCIIKNEHGEDEVVGKCLRASYWGFKAVEKTNPMSARGARICAVGNMVEKAEVNRYKEMGIWKGNSIRFIDSECNVSGEVDAFVYDDKKECIIDFFFPKSMLQTQLPLC